MKDFMVIDLKKFMKVNGMSNDKSMSKHLKGGFKMKKEKTAYEKHLESQVAYWTRISLAEREKNMKLEEIIKSIEKKICGLEKEEK